MRLTKSRLIKRVKSGLSLLGYYWFKDSITGSDGLFVKKLPNNFYLSLGMNIHRFYEDCYTCDYYLSLTTCIYSMWGDIPLLSSKRPGELLTDEEIFPSRNHDIWWSGDDSVDEFLAVVKITEPRFVTDVKLLNDIKKSKDVNLLCKMSNETINKVDGLPDTIYPFILKKEIDDIPKKWFHAAELVLKNYENDINIHQVKRLAADAYRQHILTIAEKNSGSSNRESRSAEEITGDRRSGDSLI